LRLSPFLVKCRQIKAGSACQDRSSRSESAVRLHAR